MVDVLKAVLQKGPAALAELGNAQDSARFRLAAQAASEATFDWQVAEGAVAWAGATEILPFQRNIGRAAVFLDAIDREKRAALEALLDSQSPQVTPFCIEIEIASAMGAMIFSMVGSRIANETGRTERLVGMMRDTTERSREIQRLTYLATRDELT